MTPKILFEDDVLLIIDKPSGMVVDRNGTGNVETVQDWVEEYQKLKIKYQKDIEFGMRSGVVHRLDKETSGVLIIAKTPEAFRELQRQFKNREVEKTYIALVHGRVEPAKGIISAPLGRLPWNRERFGVLPGGRDAETAYKVVRSMEYVVRGKKEEFSLVEFYPKTGRTHQIRVHAKSIGHPIVGDTFYAGRKTSRNDRKWYPRLFLHASKITFTHPVNSKRVTVEAPLPSDLPIH